VHTLLDGDTLFTLATGERAAPELPALHALMVAAGDCVHQRPGIVHYLFDYSPDMEYLEVVGPADFTTNDVEGPCAVPAPKPW